MSIAALKFKTSIAGKNYSYNYGQTVVWPQSEEAQLDAKRLITAGYAEEAESPAVETATAKGRRETATTPRQVGPRQSASAPVAGEQRRVQEEPEEKPEGDDVDQTADEKAPPQKQPAPRNKRS